MGLVRVGMVVIAVVDNVDTTKTVVVKMVDVVNVVMLVVLGDTWVTTIVVVGDWVMVWPLLVMRV